LVAAAVVVSAVVPFIFYALDDEASPDVLGRHSCPSFELALSGGLEADLSDRGASGPFTARFRAATDFIGLVTQFDVAPWSTGRPLLNGLIASWIRLKPRQHLELGFSLGFRSLLLRDSWRPGFEVGIPQEYVFFRNGSAQLGLEVRPALFLWAGGIDLSLDAALRIPIGPFVSAFIGGRLFTVDALGDAGGGVNAGLALHL
jgi:hypothetical protein